MSTFQFDTSRSVVLSEAVHAGFLHYWPGPVTFEQLLPFVQGYVEAACRAAEDTLGGFTITGIRFSDLAPETLAAMIRDCEAYCAIDKGHATGKPDYGRAFWENRQAGRSVFPTLTLSLADDGKIHAREAS